MSEGSYENPFPLWQWKIPDIVDIDLISYSLLINITLTTVLLRSIYCVAFDSILTGFNLSFFFCKNIFLLNTLN